MSFTAIISIAIVVGVMVMVRRWPTWEAAAAIADQQFHLDDLLGSALNLRPVPFDDLSGVVIALADARCRAIAPTDILISRLTGRAWSCIVLIAAIAVAMAVVPMRSAKSQRDEPDAGVLAVGIDSAPNAELLHTDSAAQVAQSDPSGEGESQITSPMDEQPAAKNPGSGKRGDQIPEAGSGTPNVGGGASSNDKRSENQAADVPTPIGTPSSQTGEMSGSGGESGQHRIGTDSIDGMTISRGSVGSVIPVWRSADWPAARAAALASVRGQTIPPGCRDLVREYFH